MLNNGLQGALNLQNQDEDKISFSYNLDIKGSQSLSFLHTGKVMNVEVSGNWSSPSFDGRYLPDQRKVNNKGFEAKWRMLYFNRPFPQQWVNDDHLLNRLKSHEDALFGVRLHIQVDQYQKATRTAKYAILVIALTFVSLFLTELIKKQKIHVFNYALIGAAMIVFYTLLLSFSEQLGYNSAYIIAAGATVPLIGWFVASLLNSPGAAYLFAIIVTVFYGFIFVIIQLEDLALLVGSVALFMIVFVLMYLSRKIDRIPAEADV